MQTLVKCLSTIFLIFGAFLFVGHYLKNKRVEELNFRYTPLVPKHPRNVVVCVLDISRCHWSYLLAKHVWCNPLAIQFLQEQNMELCLVDLQQGVQFARQQKLPHFSSYPCTMFVDGNGNEARRVYGVFGLEELKAAVFQVRTV